jgi:hypothetical protein
MAGGLEHDARVVDSWIGDLAAPLSEPGLSFGPWIASG